MLRNYLHSTAVTDTTPQQYAPRTPSKAKPTPRYLSKAQYVAGARLYALEVATLTACQHAYLPTFAWKGQACMVCSRLLGACKTVGSDDGS